jgi:isoquinoline 1-oxidoreductase
VSGGIAPERYELFDGPAYCFEVDRRDFIKTLGGGLVVLLVASRLDAQESGRRGAGGDRMPSEVGAWLHVAESGAVTVFTGKTEIGQNIRTSLTQGVAEELGVAPAAVTLLMADTAKTPFDMGTFGSRTTPTMNLQLRKVAAAARSVIADRAAARWSVDRGAVSVKNGQAAAPNQTAIGIGELVKGAPLVATVTDQTTLRPPKDWTVAGHDLPKIDGPDFVTGKHRFTADMTRPGMLHAKIVRPPAYGATLLKVDAAAALAMPGVVVVHDNNFLGVAAPTLARASSAASAIKAQWSAGSGVSARSLYADLKKAGDPAPAPAPARNAAATVDAEYTVAYIAHAPLEPRAAVAEWTGDGVTVWTGTQRPFGVQTELVDAFHVAADKVRVIVPDTGSAYGGKHTGDAAIEAARLARAAKKPVKLVWTREEEFAWAYFRPAGVIDVRAAAADDGTLTAWEFHNYNSGASGLQTPYVVAEPPREHFHDVESPLRQGSYRGLAATANHFARETAMDDLARQLGVDPVAFRIKNLKDARLAAILKAVADKAGWKPDRGRHGVGIACGVEKGGYTAAYAEVAVDDRDVRVVRLVVGFECGAIVNPNGLQNQVEGAALQGLGGALFEAIDYDNGRLTNGRFAQYRLPRFRDIPAVEVVLLDRPDLPPAGAGETPIVGVAPAIANAIFDATGARLRALPLAPHGLPAPTNQ